MAPTGAQTSLCAGILCYGQPYETLSFRLFSMNLFDAIQRVPSSALWLGLAGLLPFWLPLLPHTGFEGLTSPDQAVIIQMAYAAIILSFLGGIRWGAALKLPRGPLQSTLFVLSVVPSLAGFAALILPVTAGLLILIGGFLVQGVWDIQSSQHKQLPPWFGVLRAILTAGAVLALIVTSVIHLARS
ncbi:MAG: DUF3429 domain-containing protein [Anderseniella sp.]